MGLGRFQQMAFAKFFHMQILSANHLDIFGILDLSIPITILLAYFDRLKRASFSETRPEP